ncbi:hypothetical protein [Streptomyces sp. NPDC019224]|uniref:hypothetical protein n=1 Tax=Streptomyces sp. NPDC019224 TaxID=3154484 RepID=UPI00340757BE
MPDSPTSSARSGPGPCSAPLSRPSRGTEWGAHLALALAPAPAPAPGSGSGSGSGSGKVYALAPDEKTVWSVVGDGIAAGQRFTGDSPGARPLHG